MIINVSSGVGADTNTSAQTSLTVSATGDGYSYTSPAVLGQTISIAQTAQ